LSAIIHNQEIMHAGVKLRHVRAFLDIAASQSLSAAARARGVTQPALSRTLSELEALLEAPLFRREGRRLVLTEAGALFRGHASIAVQALEAGAAALRPGRGGGRIPVGVLPTAATQLFPRVALRFREVAPATLLSVVTGPHSYLVGLLRAGGIDLMVGRMPAPSEMAGLAFAHLYEEEVVLVVRAGHPLSGQPVSRALGHCPAILPPTGAIIRPAVDDYLASQGAGALRPAYETVALAVGRGIVLGSDAMWFISRGVVAEELARGEMTILPTQARFLSGAVGMTRRQAEAQGPGLDLLMRITREAADALASG
jgi:LysR family transcriptional regulator, pca operon transcriptional activator